MKGKYHFRVSGKRAVFDFDIRRNITIIKGDSATGKTTLLHMLYEYLRVGRESGFSVATSASYYVYLRKEIGRSWAEAFEPLKNTIIFIEENNDFVYSEEFATYVKQSGNFFVFVSRAPLHMLPYSIHEIYEIITESKHKEMKEAYHEFRELYSNFPKLSNNRADAVITEDTNSGYVFFKNAFYGRDIQAAGGNTKISRLLEDKNKVCKDSLVIADGAAFGAYIEEAIASIDEREDIRISLWMPESFEYLVLKSGIIDGERIQTILSDISTYVECGKYESWEQFFTRLLEVNTKDTNHPYDKRRLDQYYLSETVVDKICSVFPDALKALRGSAPGGKHG